MLNPSTKIVSVLATVLLFSAVVRAQTQAAPPASPVEISGYFDFYYQSSPEAHSNGVAGSANVLEGRVFDRIHNELTLNMIELSAKKKTGKVAFRLDAAFGEMVDALAANGGSSPVGNSSAVSAGANEPTRNITQATIAYSPFENLTITAGKFYSHMGFEVLKAKDNWQYSRSLGFNYAIPLWHQGLSVYYGVLPGKLAGTLYFVNAWDGRIATETNKSQTVGANINVTAIENLTVNYNYIGGIESADTRGRREAHELNATYNATPALSFAADYTLGTEQNAIPVSGGSSIGQAKWTSFALYAKATFGIYTLSPRYEIFDDANGWAVNGLASRASAPDVIVPQKITSITISNNFNLGDGFESRVEFRSDESNANGFFKNEKGVASGSQKSYTAALLYSF